MALILGCLQHLHTTTALPMYATFLSTLNAALQRTKHIYPKLYSINNQQICNVVVLLQHADVVLVHGGPHIDTPMTIRLVAFKSIPDMRRRHDGYLEYVMSKSVGVIQDLLWPESVSEQARLTAEVEKVVNEVRRVLSSSSSGGGSGGGGGGGGGEEGSAQK